MTTKQKLHQLRLNEWSSQFSAPKASGLTVKQWCDQNNMSIHTYNYWKHLLKEELASQVLPDIVPFSLRDLKELYVQFNTRNAGKPMERLEKNMLYTVYQFPYEYIKKKVDVKVTGTTIEIFYNHNCIASHHRLKGRLGQYSTVTEHMPENHQKYLEWNGNRFRQWTERIGINTYTVVNAMLASKRVEQQTYRSCMGLLKLAEKYSDTFA